MQKTILYCMMAALFASCTATRKSTQPVQWPTASQEGPEFIETISTSGSSTASARPGKKLIPFNHDGGTIESFDALRFKYSILMNVPVEEVIDSRLINFLETWYGTPYQYGGSSHDGIDCSAFTVNMMSSVFGYSLPRSSREQYAFCKKVSLKHLQYGDLVFFSTKSHISHVGIYLGNNKFAHASASNGVMISDLAEEYFRHRWAGAGRVE